MAEYIDREELLKKLALRLNHEDGKDFCTSDMVFAIDTIMHEPAAGVMPVVRCEDCKHNPRFERRGKKTVWCRQWRSEVQNTDFCSYGERRGDKC